MWVLTRAKYKLFIEEHPQNGRGYHVCSADEVLKLFELEKGLMWAAHPRINSSQAARIDTRKKPFSPRRRLESHACRPLRHRLIWETNPLRDARPLRQSLGAHRSMGRGRQRRHLPANLAGVNQALGQAQRFFNQGRLGTAVPTCSKFDIQDAA